MVMIQQILSLQTALKRTFMKRRFYLSAAAVSSFFASGYFDFECVEYQNGF